MEIHPSGFNGHARQAQTPFAHYRTPRSIKIRERINETMYLGRPYFFFLATGFLAAGFLATGFLVAHLPRVAHLEADFFAAGFFVVFTVFFAIAIVSSLLFDWRLRP